MSIESFAIALNHSRATGTARLVLIGIANHDGDGGAWPSVQTLQRYAGGIDRRAVQRAIAKLEALGEVQRIVSQGGDHSIAFHRRPNLYRFLLKCPYDCDRSSHHRTPRQGDIMPLDIDGAVVGPPAVEEPRGGRGTAGGGGRRTAQTVPLNPGETEKAKSPSRARAREDGFAAPCSEDRNGSHQPASERAGGYCLRCGATPTAVAS